MSPTPRYDAAKWALRLAVCAEFAGHGWVALNFNPAWVPFVTMFGFAHEDARLAMAIVGSADLILAASILVVPTRAALIWMTFWGAFTALLRPLAGGSMWDFVERGANWGAPLALLLLLGLPRRARDLFRG